MLNSDVYPDGIIKSNKKWVSGHLVECHTRERGSLLSVITIALGKGCTTGLWETFFAECYGQGTRQSYCALDPQELYFVEYWLTLGTRQSIYQVLDKKYSAKGLLSMFCLPRHSANTCRVHLRGLASVCGTRQRERL